MLVDGIDGRDVARPVEGIRVVAEFLNSVAFGVGILHIVREVQPLVHLCLILQASGVAFEIGIDVVTIVVQIAEREVDAFFLIASAQIHIVLLAQSGVEECTPPIIPAGILILQECSGIELTEVRMVGAGQYDFIVGHIVGIVAQCVIQVSGSGGSGGSGIAFGTSEIGLIKERTIHCFVILSGIGDDVIFGNAS